MSQEDKLELSTSSKVNKILCFYKRILRKSNSEINISASCETNLLDKHMHTVSITCHFDKARSVILIKEEGEDFDSALNKILELIDATK